ncbi:hypothetical protein SHIRM173S_10327 [Streptomyces hirsutus]
MSPQHPQEFAQQPQVAAGEAVQPVDGERLRPAAPTVARRAVSSRGSGPRGRRGSSSPVHSRGTAAGTGAPSVTTISSRVSDRTAS